MEYTTRASSLFGFNKVLLLLAILNGVGVNGHSWPDQLTCASGPFFNNNPTPGYIREYVGRASPQIDTLTTTRFTTLTSSQNVCSDRTKSPGQIANFPKLKATPGDLVQAQYLENGHIWQTLDGQNGPKANPGTIYWYGTQNPRSDRNITSVLEWTKDGKGGDGQGVLLDITPFDDGVCIEVGHENAGPGRVSGPCKSYFRLPTNVQVGKDYTVYWLWDYSLHFGPKPGYVEWYSACMDISIVSNGKRAPTTTSASAAAKSTPSKNVAPKPAVNKAAALKNKKKVVTAVKTKVSTETVATTVTRTTSVRKTGAAATPPVSLSKAKNPKVAPRDETVEVFADEGAPLRGLNRHMRREQLREEKRTTEQVEGAKRAWYSFFL
ncbi:hypothetical protein TWF694_009708 [Orbilia ellipsospora]|uniref:DUF7492 domain-containing protein n=1 Tax=Orbilia ellipsospora TaxID=2528407 RepID=A0AAV9XCT4_9PEZI